MKTIAFVIPYFGKLPGKGFELWLKSCEYNPTIDWLIFTDDHTQYYYPSNVKVKYCTFEDICQRIQACYDFEITLNRPYKLCEFKAAYGEIFEKELKGYDYWGMCDIDLIWGDIRVFLTDEILDKYDRIGNQGHLTLFKNNREVNLRYRTCVDGLLNYKVAFTNEQSFCFDESGLDAIYNALSIPYYCEVNFAHLRKYDAGFFLDLKPESESWKNHRQIFLWENGSIIRYYLHGERLEEETYMYCHFWCRPMSYKISIDGEKSKFLIYSDVVCNFTGDVDCKLVKKYGKPHRIAFWVKTIWINRKKITVKRIAFNIKGMANHIRQK